MKRKKQVVEQWWHESAPANYKWLGLGPYPDTRGLSRKEMARVVAHRTRHGRFASYFRRHRIETDAPVCTCGATLEPRHLTVCPRDRKVARTIKDKYQIDTEEELSRSSWERSTTVLESGIGYPSW